jgi:hypothetical protein
MKKRINQLVALLGVCFIIGSGCGDQSIDSKFCHERLKSSSIYLSEYYANKEKDNLIKGLVDVEIAIKCNETKVAAIEYKIMIIALLEEYKKGYQFLDSLNTEDFPYGYKRDMGKFYFLAKEYERESDLMNRNQMLEKAITTIDIYIQNEAKEHFDEKVYYDLFFLKREILNKESILFELDSLIVRFPKNKEFINILKQTFTAPHNFN